MEIVAPSPGKQEMMINIDADVIFVGGAAGCLSNDTEFLTSSGWKRFDQYLEGDDVAVYDWKTDSISYELPEQYIKLPCDKMTLVQARGIDMMLSDEHRVVYWSEKTAKQPKILSFSEVRERHERSLTKGWTGQIRTTFKVNSPGIDLTEGELRLQVAVMADGHFVPEGANNYCIVRVSKERKYKRLIEICEKYGFEYRTKGPQPSEKYSNGLFHEVVVWPKLKVKQYEDFFYKCSQEQLEIICDEVGYWDGTFVKNANGTTIRYFSKHQIDADFIQYCFHACGKNTSLVKDRREDKPSYTVNATDQGKGFRCLANKDGKVPFVEVVPEDGFKYCFTVSTGMFLVRRNGKLYITGNSGKSHSALMRSLRYINDPHYNAIYFRRTTAELEDGLFSAAIDLYDPWKPHIQQKAMRFTFDSGARIRFSHMEHEKDKFKHQGKEYSAIFFDELTLFEESQFVYLLSRTRSKAENRSFVYCTMNPDPDSFALKWVEWYLDEEGYPDQSKVGKIRYFVMDKGEPKFADDEQTLRDLYPDAFQVWNPNTEEFVEINAKTFTCILATIFDNPPVMKANPTYLADLKALPDIERARLLDGNWYLRPQGSNYFERDWLVKVDKVPLGCISCRAWDKASEEPSDKNRSPDFTACSPRMWKDKDGFYYMTWGVRSDIKDPNSNITGRLRKRPGERDQMILAQAKTDGVECHVVFARDPGAGGKVEFEESSKKIISEGFICKADPMPNNKGKRDRFSPFSSACQNGLVRIVESSFPNKETLEAFYKDLEAFTGEPSTRTYHDDLADATASAFNYINKMQHVRIVRRNQQSHSTISKDLLREFRNN